MHGENPGKRASKEEWKGEDLKDVLEKIFKKMNSASREMKEEITNLSLEVQELRDEMKKEREERESWKAEIEDVRKDIDRLKRFEGIMEEKWMSREREERKRNVIIQGLVEREGKVVQLNCAQKGISQVKCMFLVC